MSEHLTARDRRLIDQAEDDREGYGSLLDGEESDRQAGRDDDQRLGQDW